MSKPTIIVPKPKKLSLYRWIILIALAVLYVWAFSGVPVEGIKDTAGQITKAIMTGIVNPDWAYVSSPDGEDLLHGLIDTLAIAILGTFVSAFLSIPFAFWAAANMSTGKVTSSAGKFVLSFIRTFPELVMALLFIKAVGPGSFAGVLALGLHSIGMLGKLYSEGIENIEKGPTEALVATGANRFQVLWYAVLPQVLPDFLSYTLYRFEINVRSATILGVIGAGGIGTPLIFALSSRNWPRVGIILLGIIMMVIIIDFISSSIRKRVV
ncbi:phosphonate ABC transporter, permease protein PhnE [Bacillus pseudomycoides]|uniref:Phosphonate ABC transporter, permease protein PhnE n=1 Tax=Bacillus pseudomycoides TaxID=64104 RepID=A0AA91VBN0_9BACI|nr:MULTISPECIES: phosphonate ABC transporter, permease protein PhnE [Bacillus]PEB52111.1 phosphonate ABC transporter, permease protein PhnE [Bacillus sp. AFS098217]PED82117.1 phosphonate ABC transporter, permease protein PhnE [Bacillus pseudomycoides]PEU10840.1 phosphonate ABC transporter, permease protein PhnE [Bacillus sp. AFS019443]PEU20761.1 phosphonate ABC transporter, permease protein PhnE [Bacillus sp. AFS014408]PFW61268.1 phosphonate ABC transporter, permease protein PhnE [Bacillus sp.